MKALKPYILLATSLLLCSCAEMKNSPDNSGDKNQSSNQSNNNNSNNNNDIPTFDGSSDHPDWECLINRDCGASGFYCLDHKCYVEGVFSIKQDALPEAKAENFYDFRLEAFNGSEPYEWVINGPLPEGLTYDFTGHITGVPSLASVGSYPLRVIALDNDGKKASADLTLVVSEPDIYVATTELPQAHMEEEYSAQLEAAYGTEPFQWRLQSGSLPAGLTLNSDGSITGTPTEAGTFSFTVKVIDNSEQIFIATRNLELYVEPQPLTIKAGLYTFDLGSLRSELAGNSVTILMPMVNGYSATLGATGGVPPYTWEEDNNLIISLALSLLGFKVGLPDGLTLNEAGVINGKATQEPSAIKIPNTEIELQGYLFMAKVTDSEGSVATGIFLIPVVDLASIWDFITNIKLF